MTKTPPLSLTKNTTTKGALGVAGPAGILAAAFEAGEQVTIEGKFGGERVYLGHGTQAFDLNEDAVTFQRVGLDRTIGEVAAFPGYTIAVYLIDLTRLEDAPQLADVVAASREASMRRHVEMEARIRDEDNWLEADDA
jgi:hypothetical protein